MAAKSDFLHKLIADFYSEAKSRGNLGLLEDFSIENLNMLADKITIKEADDFTDMCPIRLDRTTDVLSINEIEIGKYDQNYLTMTNLLFGAMPNCRGLQTFQMGHCAGITASIIGDSGEYDPYERFRSINQELNTAIGCDAALGMCRARSDEELIEILVKCGFGQPKSQEETAERPNERAEVEKVSRDAAKKFLEQLAYFHENHWGKGYNVEDDKRNISDCLSGLSNPMELAKNFEEQPMETNGLTGRSK